MSDGSVAVGVIARERAATPARTQTVSGFLDATYPSRSSRCRFRFDPPTHGDFTCPRGNAVHPGDKVGRVSALLTRKVMAGESGARRLALFEERDPVLSARCDATIRNPHAPTAANDGFRGRSVASTLGSGLDTALPGLLDRLRKLSTDGRAELHVEAELNRISSPINVRACAPATPGVLGVQPSAVRCGVVLSPTLGRPQAG